MPTLTIIAGANGSGKTTLTADASFFRNLPLLDPDAASRTLQPAALTAPITAARQVIREAAAHIRASRSFAVETTLSGRSYLQMMLSARVAGFEVVLVYIGTDEVEINLHRIRNRVLAGGHNVPEVDVRRRFRRSFLNLPLAISRADHTIFFDNSSPEGHRLVALLSGTNKQWFEPVPHWAAPIRKAEQMRSQ